MSFEPFDHFVVYLRSDQASGSPIDFVTTLETPIDCRRGEWQVALLSGEFPLISLADQLGFVCADIVDYIAAGQQDSQSQIVRTLPYRQAATTSFYETSSVIPWKKLDRTFISQIRLYLRTFTNSVPVLHPANDRICEIQLVFRKVSP